MSFIKKLLTTKNPTQTVFTFSDLSNVSEQYAGTKLKSALKYAVKKQDIIRISKGIYCLSKNYSKQEFANKYRSPSYISLYTVLQEEGAVFQPYSSIYVSANRSQKIEMDAQIYIYRKIKDEILLNTLGIKHINTIYKATLERALCDKLYLDGLEYFDNIRKVDWELMHQLNTTVYGNNSTIATFIATYESS